MWISGTKHNKEMTYYKADHECISCFSAFGWLACTAHSVMGALLSYRGLISLQRLSSNQSINNTFINYHGNTSGNPEEDHALMNHHFLLWFTSHVIVFSFIPVLRQVFEKYIYNIKWVYNF